MQKICLLCTSKGQFRNEWWEEHGHRLLTRLGEVSKILKTSIEEGYYNRLGQDCHLGILFPYRAPSHQTPQWQFLSDMRQKMDVSIEFSHLLLWILLRYSPSAL